MTLDEIAEARARIAQEIVDLEARLNTLDTQIRALDLAEADCLAAMQKAAQ